MNDYIYIGKIVGTHGIKGEIRILSDSEIKNQVFVPNFKVYFGNDKNEFTITSYRHHKNYEMITMAGYNNINDVLQFKNQNVYVKRSDLQIEDYLLDDLIGLDIIDNDNVIGKVEDVVKNGNNILLKIDGEHSFYIPKVDEYIIKVDIEDKKIYVKNIGGLII